MTRKHAHDTDTDVTPTVDETPPTAETAPPVVESAIDVAPAVDDIEPLPLAPTPHPSIFVNGIPTAGAVLTAAEWQELVAKGEATATQDPWNKAKVTYAMVPTTTEAHVGG